MNYLIIGDPHFTNKNLDKAKALFDEIEQLNFETNIWLGDMFDTKEIIRGKSLNFVFDRLKNSNSKHIILVGNHDWFNRECREHALEVLKQLPNVTIVDQSTTIDGMYFMPYMHDLDEFKKKLKYAKGEPVLFMHNEIKGFDYGNGHIADCNLTSRSFSKFKRVIAGHFHKHQEKGNIMYLGSPFSQSFGESNQDKYLASYDSDTNKLELIKTDFPQHITIEQDCNKSVSREYGDPEFESGYNYVRCILTGKQENINKFPKDLYPHVKFIERPDATDLDAKISDALDNVSQFREWGKEIKKLDEKTIDLGLQILEKVKK